MPRLYPVLTSLLKQQPDPLIASSSALWEDPDTCLGAALPDFSQPVVCRLRVLANRQLLARPVSYLFPQSGADFAASITVHDSNDVFEIGRTTPGHYSPSQALDQSLALTHAHRILERDPARERLLCAIVHETILSGLESISKIIDSHVPTQVFFLPAISPCRKSKAA